MLNRAEQEWPSEQEAEQAAIDTLETLLDHSDIQQVVLMLARICNEKAEHVRTNWQDERMANAWERNGQLLEKTEVHLRRTY